MILIPVGVGISRGEMLQGTPPLPQPIAILMALLLIGGIVVVLIGIFWRNPEVNANEDDAE